MSRKGSETWAPAFTTERIPTLHPETASLIPGAKISWDGERHAYRNCAVDELCASRPES
jgi:hypothetical protein